MNKIDYCRECKPECDRQMLRKRTLCGRKCNERYCTLHSKIINNGGKVPTQSAECNINTNAAVCGTCKRSGGTIVPINVREVKNALQGFFKSYAAENRRYYLEKPSPKSKSS